MVKNTKILNSNNLNRNRMSEKKFKLKESVMNCFTHRLHDKRENFKYWNDIGVSGNSLEETKEVHISYGIKTSESSTSLCGWNGAKKKGEFCFTLNIEDFSGKKYKELKDPEVLYSLINELEEVSNKFINNLNSK